MNFRWYAWRELDPDTLYALLKLRSDIFVVEQNCVFSDMDGLDAQCEHLCVRDAAGKMLGGLRLLPPGLKGPHPSIGRVVVAVEARGAQLGRELMLQGLARCAERFGGHTVQLGGQQHLQRFYESLGFEVTGEPYLEDGIPHVDMLRRAAILPR